MPQLKVRDFGPIQSCLSGRQAGFEANNGWLSIHKVTALTGGQGTGKSTILKLLSTFAWLEKMLYKGDLKESDVILKGRFENTYCSYHRLENYFRPGTRIGYRGTAYAFLYEQGKLMVDSIRDFRYMIPRIMYVPAERNLLSAASKPQRLKGLPPSLYDFRQEYDRARQELAEALPLPMDGLKFQYEKRHMTSYILGDDYKLSLPEASNGLQSAVPLLLVSESLAKETFINIVEEPEQSLFPPSQKVVLFKLLEFVNRSAANQLIFTTHSPYILNYLMLALKGYTLLGKVRQSERAPELLSRLGAIVPASACSSPKDTVIYECREDGSITKLPEYDGLPSDENILNTLLADSNLLFDALMEIEEAL